MSIPDIGKEPTIHGEERGSRYPPQQRRLGPKGVALRPDPRGRRRRRARARARACRHPRTTSEAHQRVQPERINAAGPAAAGTAHANAPTLRQDGLGGGGCDARANRKQEKVRAIIPAERQGRSARPGAGLPWSRPQPPRLRRIHQGKIKVAAITADARWEAMVRRTRPSPCDDGQRRGCRGAIG